MSNKGKDTLGDRMKFYEKQQSGRLIPLIPAICRLDGKAFHTFTRGMKRPFDEGLSGGMRDTTKYLVAETGARIGYTQSDEISLVWYNEDLETMLPFDGKVPKMTSILAAMTSVYFNRILGTYLPEKQGESPLFDARVWSVPTLNEACLYLLWREQDATRNSISMAAQSVYSHRELMGKSSSDKHEMLFQKGINWVEYPSAFKRGTYFQKRTVERPFTPEEIEKMPPKHEVFLTPNMRVKRREIVMLDIPPLKSIQNRIDVLFNGLEPEIRT